jgi:hypothetical protein
MVHPQVEGVELIPTWPRTRRACTCHLDGEIVLGGEAVTEVPSTVCSPPLFPR